MGPIIRCPECGTENSDFARFMGLSRCRKCGYDLELVEVSEMLRRGEPLRGRSSLYRYRVSLQEATFQPQGVLTAPPLLLDAGRRVLRVLGNPQATPGPDMLWQRLKGVQEEVPFDQVARIEVTYRSEQVPRRDHPYRHHWDVALVLEDGREIPLGRITAERKFPGPVRSHHHALRLGHALHELTGRPLEYQTASGEVQ